jgi:hypothetical protein
LLRGCGVAKNGVSAAAVLDRSGSMRRRSSVAGRRADVGAEAARVMFQER